MDISQTTQGDVNEKQPSASAQSSSSVDNRSTSHEEPEIVLSKDGFKLFPQPVLGDDLDPLNWSFFQKHVILSIIMAMYVAIILQ